MGYRESFLYTNFLPTRIQGLEVKLPDMEGEKKMKYLIFTSNL